MNLRSWIGSAVLLAALAGTGAGLAAWKQETTREADAAAASQPEHMESILVATATAREHRRSSTSVGTVLAMQSVALKNELAGTVRRVNLTPGQIVDAGAVLVALDVSVEEAELKSFEAQAELANTLLRRVEMAQGNGAVSEIEVDRARAERDVALAQVARLKAVIDRKTIYAPFRARIGLSDVHIGQYLAEGTELTTLQGVADAAHVDFSVAQHIAQGLAEGDAVEILAGDRTISAKIAAIDARIDSTTRNALVRATIEGDEAPRPGASVRVRVPAGPKVAAVSVPVSALRKSPAGDHVFVIASDKEGKPRASERHVQAGAMLGDEILVLEGLQPGEQVAASGSFKLRDGVLVGIANAPAKSTQAAK